MNGSGKETYHAPFHSVHHHWGNLMDHASDRPDRCRPIDSRELHASMVRALLEPSCELSQRTPSSYLERIAAFRDSYLLDEYLRKYPRKGEIDTRAAALKKMFEREGKNREANDRISSRSYGDDPRVRIVYHNACRKAATALGRFNPSRFREGLRHGPGSTCRLKGDSTSVANKLDGVPTVTAKARELGYLVLTESPMWVFNISDQISPDSVLRIEDNEEVTTVPKNAETDRVIAIQPDINIYCQLAVGYCMRYALERVGIDLNDQTINQRRALLGSKYGKLATVDLSSASDSIVWSLVWDFLGNWSDLDGQIDRNWWRVLDALRCETGLVDGVRHTWERFSAMGNGYTFELESLIFWALTVSTCEVLGIPPDVSVYGDDIICPVEILPLLEKVFSFCGFDFNSKKTHSSQPPFSFRESCGKHYLDGIDVTPFYVDKELSETSEIMLLANNLVRWAAFPGGYGRDGRLLPVWKWVVSHLPEAARKSGIPLGEDNDALIKSFDEFQPSIKYLRGPLQYYHYKTDGLWCLNDSDVSVQVCTKVVSKSNPRPLDLGYTCKTYSKVFGEKAISDDQSYLVWHYQKSFRRFQPWIPRTDLENAIDSLRSLDPYIRYRSSTFKYRYKAGRRYTRSWNDCGPWL